MSLEHTKAIINGLFKNDNTAILTFFISMMSLAYYTELVPDWLLYILFLVSIGLTFGSLVIKLILKVERHFKLFRAETDELVKNKDFSKIEKSSIKKITEKISEIEDKITNKDIDTEASKSEDEALLDGLKQLNGDITEAHPEIKKQIADIEAKIAEVSKEE